ncbi:ATP-binding protein [Haloarcula japonica]|uniref:ATP-binding protein n=1 Tax=Haloarcula japonica TaxID=29282 RepID=UPI0039F688FB
MPPSISELQRRLEKHGLDDNPKAQKLLTQATAPYLDQEQQWRARILLQKLIQKHRRYPFTDSVPQISYLTDQAILGKTIKSEKLYRLQEQDLVQHAGIFGRSGSGKTTLMRNLMAELSAPFWAFDRKQDYRHLIHDFDDLLVLPWYNIKFNPLKPPEGVKPILWIQVFATIFTDSMDLLSASRGFLIAVVAELYQDYNLLKENTGPYPTLQDLFQKINDWKAHPSSKEGQYKGTVKSRLRGLTKVGGHIFNFSEGYSIEELRHRNVVYEVGGLYKEFQALMQAMLFAYVYYHQLAQANRSGELQLILFVEEAKQLFSVYQEQQSAKGIPVIDDLMAQSREFGLGIVAADQEPGKLTESLKANTKTKVMLPLESTQFTKIVDALGLNDIQKEYARNLETGHAIVKHGGRDPVPVQLKNYQTETVTEKELIEDQREKWNQLDFTPSKKPNFSPSESTDTGSTPSTDRQRDAESTESVQIALSEEADDLLEHIAENPLQFVTDRYDSLSLSYYKGNEAKKELLEEDLVSEESVGTGQSKGTMFGLTEKGRAYLQEEDVEVQWKGRGGIRHLYWQDQIRDLLEEHGWTAFIEKLDADVYGIDGGDEIAVEVAMGVNDRELDHVEDHLDTGWKTVVAARNQSVKKGLQRKLEDSDLDASQVALTTVRKLDAEDIQL